MDIKSLKNSGKVYLAGNIVFCFIWIALSFLACDNKESHPPEEQAVNKNQFEIVTSIPIETELSGCETRRASEVWVEMIKKAENKIDFGEFYLTGKDGESLDPIVNEILNAAERGVKIRFLIDKKMGKNSVEMVRKLSGKDNIEIAEFLWEEGGTLHVKYFVVDEKSAFIGSQNFDWRALTHIHETGVKIEDSVFAKALTAIFNADWDFMKGNSNAYVELKEKSLNTFSAEAFLVGSPPEKLPDAVKPSIDVLLELINNAEHTITVQLLSYSRKIYGDKKTFDDIDDALRNAAGRGVDVRMLLSNWNKRKSGVGYLKELSEIDGIDIKFINIPEFSGGFFPYSRVIHSKVLRVDEKNCWIGTSNWGYGYFYESRNLEMVFRNTEMAEILDCLFNSLWNSPYGEVVDIDKEYEPPKIF